MKIVNQENGQDIGLIKVQNTSENDETEVPDINDGKNEEEDSIREAEENDNISDGEKINNTVQEDETSRVSQDDNYHSAIDDDDLDDTIQFGHPVTNLFCQGTSEYQQQRKAV